MITASINGQRIAYDDTGRPVEFGQHLYRASRYAFTTSLHRAELAAGRPPLRAG